LLFGKNSGAIPKESAWMKLVSSAVVTELALYSCMLPAVESADEFFHRHTFRYWTLGTGCRFAHEIELILRRLSPTEEVWMFT
jgi:hypothetical protein